MGSFKISKKELGSALEELLDSFEGDINEQDFREMSNEVADNYKNFTK